MPDKSDEEIRKNIKHFEESLPATERNPDAQEDTQRLIEHAAQPLPLDEDRPHPDERYSENQTHSPCAFLNKLQPTAPIAQWTEHRTSN